MAVITLYNAKQTIWLWQWVSLGVVSVGGFNCLGAVASSPLPEKGMAFVSFDGFRYNDHTDDFVFGRRSMSTDQSMTYEAILEVIDQWPSTKRLTLIQDILHTLMPSPAKRRRNTLEKALGLLATSEPAPSDEAVDRWLNERRMEKYG
jgi:hypothetical protein